MEKEKEEILYGKKKKKKKKKKTKMKQKERKKERKKELFKATLRDLGYKVNKGRVCTNKWKILQNSE